MRDFTLNRSAPEPVAELPAEVGEAQPLPVSPLVLEPLTGPELVQPEGARRLGHVRGGGKACTNRGHEVGRVSSDEATVNA